MDFELENVVSRNLNYSDSYFCLFCYGVYYHLGKKTDIYCVFKFRKFPCIYTNILVYTWSYDNLDYHLVQAYTSFLHGRMSALTDL